MPTHIFSRSEERSHQPNAPSVVAASDDLLAALSRLEQASLDEDAGAVRPGVACLRDSVRRLVASHLLSESDRLLIQRALVRFEEVLGDEHECYVALWRHVTRAPHPLDLSTKPPPRKAGGRPVPVRNRR